MKKADNEPLARRVARLTLSSAPFGLFIGLVPTSISASDSGHSELALVLLVIAWLSAALGTYLAEPLWSITPKVRLSITVAVSLLAFAICGATLYYERQPASKLLPPLPPRPPVALLVDPREPATLMEQSAIDKLRPTLVEIPITFGKVTTPIFGFCGFDSDGDKDDVAFATDIDVWNNSDKTIVLTFELLLQGEGENLRLDNSGRGRWNRQIGANDSISENSRDGKPYPYILSPLEIPAHWFRSGTLMFVAADKAKRKIAEQVGDPKKFVFRLVVKNLGTGKSVSLVLPSRYPAISDSAISNQMQRMWGVSGPIQ